MRSTSLAVLLALVALTVTGACGDDGGGDDGPGAQETTTSTEPAGDSPEAAVVAELETGFERVEVDCPAEMDEGPGTYDCDVVLDGEAGIATVEVDGDDVEIVNLVRTFSEIGESISNP